MELISAMGRLNDLLEQELRKAGEQGDIFKVIFPGTSVLEDYVAVDDCNAVIWCMFVGGAPSVTFPNPSTTVNDCFAPLAYNLTMGIQRPAPDADTFGKDFDAPDENALFEAANQQIKDMEMMQAAVNRLKATGGASNVLLGSYTNSGPDGGIYAGQWTLAIDLF